MEASHSLCLLDSVPDPWCLMIQYNDLFMSLSPQFEALINLQQRRSPPCCTPRWPPHKLPQSTTPYCKGSIWASLRTPQKCFCFVTDPSEVFLPRYGPLRSVQVRDLSFLILVDCRGRSFNDNMDKNPFNECLQRMHPLLS